MNLITDPEVVLVGQNIAYDLAVGCVGMGDLEQEAIDLTFAAYRAGRVRDVKIRQELLDIAAGRRQDGGHNVVLRNDEWVRAEYSLVAMEKRYLGRDRSEDKGEKAWRKRYGELYSVPLDAWPEDALRYAREDAEGTLGVFNAQWQAGVLGCAEHSPDIINEREQCFAAWALHLASCWGIRTDPSAVAALEKEVNARHQAIQARMHAEGLFKVGGTKKAPKLTKDMKAIRARVIKAFAARNQAAPISAKGNVKTDADTLSQSGDDLLEELGSGGPIATVRNTFLPVLKEGLKYPINTSYSVLMNTGRVSSWKPNLQNQPRSLGVRECWVPRPGFLFSSVDYDAAELRCLSQVLLWTVGWSKMAEFFQANPNGDPHLALAATMLGITLEEAQQRKKDKDVKDARQKAKAPNFGWPGGLGVDKFMDYARKSYGTIFTRPQALLVKEQYLQTWPEVRHYFKLISQRAERGPFTMMQLAPGGKPHRYRGNVGYTDGCNTLFQGLAADGAKEAMCRISYECYTGRTWDSDEPSPLAGSRLVAFLHDESFMEVPEDCAHEAATRQAELMISGMRSWVVDVPVTCSPALQRRWLKNAEPVYVNGRLVPWEPK